MLASQIACGSQLMDPGAEGLGSSQSRRITKPRRDPNNHGWASSRRWQHQRLAYIDILASQNSREFLSIRRFLLNRGAIRYSVQPLGTRSPSSSRPASIRDAAAAPQAQPATTTQMLRAARRAQLLWPATARRRAISLGAALAPRRPPAPLARLFATTKTTTGIVGLPVDPHARETLIALNEKLLDEIKQVPEGAEYRKSVEATCNYRLKCLREHEDEATLEELIGIVRCP